MDQAITEHDESNLIQSQQIPDGANGDPNENDRPDGDAIKRSNLPEPRDRYAKSVKLVIIFKLHISCHIICISSICISVYIVGIEGFKWHGYSLE